MIKVILVDDHILVRSGIEALLNAENDIRVIAACGCGEEALEIINQQTPDVILMDINMPGMGGIEACRRLLKTLPEIKVIGLSVQTSPTLTKQLLKLGVTGFISKTCAADEMVKAIRTVMSGNFYLFPESEIEYRDVGRAPTSITPFDALSQRESQVTNLTLQGSTIQEISQILQLNAKTVNTYRYRIYEKLQIKNDVELTRLAVKFNYLDTV
ncbi:response regulator [Methylomonas paludis]|uniref:Response regulator n=2 Tax=Methylomonas paludis TaxID=1173101 RepID=A0A975RAM5_9GAMM|nr:response regulator [Methylomonas paludis]